MHIEHQDGRMKIEKQRLQASGVRADGTALSGGLPGGEDKSWMERTVEGGRGGKGGRGEISVLESGTAPGLSLR